MPHDAFAKFILRVNQGAGSTTVGADHAKDALKALRDLHDRGLIVVTVTDQKGQTWGVKELQRQAELDFSPPW